MYLSRPVLAAVMLALSTAAHAATVAFNADPFEGTTALTDPGRQVVGGAGTPVSFNIATDVLAFNPAVFGIDQVQFANGLDTDLPSTGVNVVVIQNTGTPFLAGIAANLIAARITDPGPGFFIYFNTNLDVARLVYSTDLSDDQADLAVLARLTDLSGPAGFAALPTITEANFAPTPEPSSLLLTSAGALLAGIWSRRRRRA